MFGYPGAIAAERLAPRGDRTAHAIGAVLMAGAAVAFARAVGW